MSMDLMEKVANLLPELLLTAVIGFQAFLFRQISEARREHLELRVEIAQTYVTTPELTRVVDRLEAVLRDQNNTLLSALKQRTPL
ncbi:hypothetical protein D3C81_1301880 [compost metagenome]